MYSGAVSGGAEKCKAKDFFINDFNFGLATDCVVVKCGERRRIAWLGMASQSIAKDFL